MPQKTKQISLKDWQKIVATDIISGNYKHYHIRVRRQAGKSFLCAFLACAYTLRRPNRTVVIISNSKVQARQTYIDDGTKLLGILTENDIKYKDKKEGIIQVYSRNRKGKITGTSTILLRGLKNPDSLRGITADLVILDEMADYPHGLVNSVVLPLVQVRKGNLVYTSTPKGTQLNEFYEAEQKIKEGIWQGKTFHMGIYDDKSLTALDVKQIEDEYRGKHNDFVREQLAEYGSSREKAFPVYKSNLSIIDSYDFDATYPLVLGIDWGFSPDPSVCLFLQQKDEFIVAFDEIVVNNLTVSMFYQKIEEKLKKIKPRVIRAYADPSAPANIADFNNNAMLHGRPAFCYAGRSDHIALDWITNAMMCRRPKYYVSGQGEAKKYPQFLLTNKMSITDISLENLENIFSGTPIERTQNKQYTHCVDALKYAFSHNIFAVQDVVGNVLFNANKHKIQMKAREEDKYMTKQEYERYIRYQNKKIKNPLKIRSRIL